MHEQQQPPRAGGEAGRDGGAQPRARDDAEERGRDEVEPAHRRAAERRVLQARDRMAGGRRDRRVVQRRRRRPDLRRSPDEHDVDDGEHDEPGGERPARRERRGELGDRHGGERDQRDRRALREQPVGEPGDEPEHDARAVRAAAWRRRAPASRPRRASASACGPPATTRRTTMPIASATAGSSDADPAEPSARRRLARQRARSPPAPRTGRRTTERGSGARRLGEVADPLGRLVLRPRVLERGDQLLDEARRRVDPRRRRRPARRPPRPRARSARTSA